MCLCRLTHTLARPLLGYDILWGLWLFEQYWKFGANCLSISKTHLIKIVKTIKFCEVFLRDCCAELSPCDRGAISFQNKCHQNHKKTEVRSEQVKQNCLIAFMFKLKIKPQKVTHRIVFVEKKKSLLWLYTCAVQWRYLIPALNTRLALA